MSNPEVSPSVAMPTYTPLHYERTSRDVTVISLPLAEGSTTREYVTLDATKANATSASVPRPPFTRFIPDGMHIRPLSQNGISVEYDGKTLLYPSEVVTHPYPLALSSLAIKCVDIAVVDVDKGLMLIGDRDQEPQPGPWIIGGRKRAGETDIEAAQRNLKRELDITPEPGEFMSIGMSYDMIWDTREQDPTYNENGQQVAGCQMVSSPVILPVDSAELQTAHNEEYSGLTWMKLDDIVDSPSGTYHPALVDMAFDTMERLSRPDIVAPNNHATLAFRAVATAAYHQAQAARA